MTLDEIKLYLPKFLSPTSERQLFEELERFPGNIDQRFYTHRLWEEQTIFQGDGIKDLLVVNLPSPEIRPTPSMILSNTCDISVENERPFPSALCYAPIFNLHKYREGLLKRGIHNPQSIDNHLQAIRRQRVTQIFYLPKGDRLEQESLVFLDRICSCRNDSVSRSDLTEKRLFTLSNFGLWVFLLKLSIHLTRFNNKADRLSG